MGQSGAVSPDASIESDTDFADALAKLREGVEGYGDRISANAAVLRAVDDLEVETSIISHEKVSQSVWRYEHDADLVRGEIERTIERVENEDADTENIVAAFCIAADRLDAPISDGR